MNCNTTHYRANSSSVPGDPTASANAWGGPVNAHGGVYHSNFSMGESAGAGVRLGPVDVYGDSFWSRGQHTLTGSVYERFTRRWTLSQFVTRSGGKTSVNFGGSYTSNLVTASVGYTQAFVPYSNTPFQKVISITLAFQLPIGKLNVGTVASPGGGVKWSTYGDTYVQAPWLPTAAGQRAQGRTKIRGVVVEGRVVDSFGVPVVGAAVDVNGQTFYTDDNGKFSARVKKNVAVTLTVNVEAFSTPGKWECVSCPATATPGEDISITVRRR